jgi:hypothetical protein
MERGDIYDQQSAVDRADTKKRRVDVLIVFECREWEAAEYVRDAIASAQKKALIQLPHEGGEEVGMDECAHWLRTFVTEVPTGFIPSGDPFWMPV